MRRSCPSVVAALAASLVAAAMGCGGETAAASPKAPRGEGRAAAPAPLSAVVESVTVDAPVALPSQLHVERDAFVVARASGTIDAIGADLGSAVAAGTTLARIESADQRLGLERAELERAAAWRLAQRARELTRAGGVTPADSDLAEVALRRAEITLAEARRALVLTDVASPFAGVVSARRARPGQLVRSGDTLFRVTERGPLLARVHAPEALAATLRPGSVARVVAQAGRATSSATVLRVAPAVDAASGTREVVLRVAGREGLLPGSGVLVRLGAERRRALVVPRGIVTADGYALVLNDGRSTLRAVLLGDTLADGRVEVLGGLAAGERVSRPAP